MAFKFEGSVRLVVTVGVYCVLAMTNALEAVGGGPTGLAHGMIHAACYALLVWVHWPISSGRTSGRRR